MDQKNDMDEKNTNTVLGTASIIFGILGIILYFIGWFFYSFLDNRIYGIITGLISSILAIILGYLAKKQGDTYGYYGILLGLTLLIIGFLTFLLTNIAYVETGYYS
jgi:hypothetical protein